MAGNHGRRAVRSGTGSPGRSDVRPLSAAELAVLVLLLRPLRRAASEAPEHPTAGDRPITSSG
ncbi:hypothetical protein AQJ64_31800 [Streptomyces griseoruber]|uniref:Uncharacterized protein n=1 Tax=Streptomyces griseoruber TaxID=1943 RepID=A0A101SQT3_9ACTN|nr:hypothetical protein AQJ64_31800 [Streptomyces griseoruber]